MPFEVARATARARQAIDQREQPYRQEMADLYARTIEEIEHELNLLTERIMNARAWGEEVNVSWLNQQERYVRMLQVAEWEYARFAYDGAELVGRSRIAAVRGGALDALDLMDASGISVVGGGGTINTGAVEAAVARTRTSALQKSLARYGIDGQKLIRDALLEGIAMGRSPRTIAQEISRGLRAPVNQAGLEALVRTESMQAYRASLNDQYAQMAHLIEGYRRTAAKSRRTCLACLAMDGKVQAEPWDDFHVCCRCINTPVPKGISIAYETGEDWFRRQPEQVQRRMLPSRRAYDAYVAGTVTLDDFVGIRRSRTWGNSVYQRSGREALGEDQERLAA